ncbi:peroxiredoxin [Streptomyces sp. NPDC001691]|uniref:peroxiredoxin n=1 Tax=unclassified Streptomyces TaxID=2593676 RepID=UPI000DE82F61|nr:peroxiredoxin [Streptomyces sp. SDr-06]RCH59688.1 peroxiredoxin [Streptomyces sp. SDr-06]
MTLSPRKGELVDDFTLPGGVLTPDGGFHRGEYWLRAERRHPLVLAFYPLDDTAVCTKQLCSYSNDLDALAETGTEIWAISPQNLDSHEAFARKHGLRMPLLSDTDRVVAHSLGITAPGIGVRRAVFIIAPDGTLHWKHIALLGATFQNTGTLTRHLARFRTG